MILTREQILAAADAATQDVPTPEWAPPGTDPKECFVRIRTLSGAERDRWEESRIKGKGKDRKTNYDNITASLIALCAVGEDGKPLFTSADVNGLGRLSARALSRVFEACQKLNGLTAEEVEELAKN